MLDKLELLIKLIKENPDLPVIYHSDLYDKNFTSIENVEIREYVKLCGELYFRAENYPELKKYKCIAVWIE